jgi:hypothetical protein
MGNRDKQNRPALKHGGYSSTAVLPGEDKAEFEKLHRDLIAELTPNGLLEDDIVATMAHLIWRKQNLETFRIAAFAKDRCHEIRSRIPQDLMEFDLPMLATFKTIKKVDPAEREAAIHAAEAQIRKELGDKLELVEIGEIATVDRLMKDLEVQERLDGVIDRCLKRLLFVRGLKSISSSSSVAASQPPIKKLSAA